MHETQARPGWTPDFDGATVSANAGGALARRVARPAAETAGAAAARAASGALGTAATFVLALAAGLLFLLAAAGVIAF